MADMQFLKNAKKDLEKDGIQIGAGEPPRYWFSTGNYVVNKIISGSFYRGVPQGRAIGLAGPSGSGKSFLAANAMREAQQEGAHIITIDSENALDEEFVQKIGVDTENNYTYVEADTITQCKKIVSSCIKGYKNEYGEDSEGPKVLFVIDSLDMLMTETEEEHFEKGVTKGDQGQRNKQLKAMLREFVQAIKRPNISMLVTTQVYKNQDIMNGEGTWIVSDAIKFSLSQIVMLTKLKLRGKEKEIEGIRMKAEGYKTRFTKPFQSVTVEVPYDTGMSPYNGLLETATNMGVVHKKGSRYYIDGEEKTWFAKDFYDYAPKVLEMCESKRERFIEALIDEDEADMNEAQTAKARRQEKAAEGLADAER